MKKCAERGLLAGVLFAAALASLLAEAAPEPLASGEQAVAFAQRVMLDVSRGKLRQAWRRLRDNTVLPPERIDAFAADYERRLVEVIQHFGPAVGVEQVAEEALGRSLLRLTYLVKYQRSAIAWYLYFYRVEDRWLVSEIHYDLNGNSLFQVVHPAAAGGVADLAWREEIERRLAELAERLERLRVAAPEEFAATAVDPEARPFLELAARVAALEEAAVRGEDLGERIAGVGRSLEDVQKRLDVLEQRVDPREIQEM